MYILFTVWEGWNKKMLLVHTLPSVSAITLGKERRDWAPGGTVLPRVGAKTHGKGSVFAESRSQNTRQSFQVCRVSSMKHTTKLPSLPCAPLLAHGKIWFAECSSWLMANFAVCHPRQIVVTAVRASSVTLFFASVEFGTRQKLVVWMYRSTRQRTCLLSMALPCGECRVSLTATFLPCVYVHLPSAGGTRLSAGIQ
jgi:hypothetical protein